MYKLCLLITIFWFIESKAQDSVVIMPTIDTAVVLKQQDTIQLKTNRFIPPSIKGNAFFPYSKKKMQFATYSQLAAYSANFSSLYFYWYKDYPTTAFHFFNDNGEYLQMDKVSHVFGAYLGGRMSMQMLKWAGASKNKYVWIGGMSGMAYETLIEVMDGFSANWGFSCGDYIADITGTSILISQELLWDEQRVTVKYSTHYETYADPNLERFAVKEFGKTTSSRLFKNYNPQTYWLSANLKSFFKQSNIPSWLNIAFGYGAANIIGAYNNNIIPVDANGVPQKEINADDIYPRYRRWYIAPDVDLTRIKTKSKVLKTVLFLLNTVKFPTPSLELSQGKVKWNWIHF